MKKLILCFITVTAVFFITCSDPIFYNISMEEKKLDPKIPGSPTNFAVFQENLYVASGETLYKYNGTAQGYTDRGSWNETKPGGRIFALAATNEYLYILCEVSNERVLKRYNGIGWETITNATAHNILSIYSTNDMLFIGAGNLPSLYILAFDGVNFKRPVENTGNMLINGAASSYGTYYLSAKDLYKENEGGIYTGTPDIMSLIGNLNNIPFIGIINLDIQTIAAITQDGKLYDVPSLAQNVNISTGKNYMATGALAVWENYGNRLLLAGRQDLITVSTSTGYTYGYVELNINAGLSGTFVEPGGAVSTINEGDNGKYKNSIGVYPLSDIIQSPKDNERKVLFASTQKEGVWSYRLRDGSWNWNAEQ